MEAAGEAMRQIRLRGLSGIILIDFINMKDEDHLRSLMECLRRAAAQDPVRTTVVDRTALQLVEITRKKERRTLREQLSDQVSFS
jgi:ribonuclease G